MKHQIEFQAATYGTAYVREVPAAVMEHFKQHAHCAGCRQKIHFPDVPLERRGAYIYHPSCATRADTAARSVTPTTPKVIAHIMGTALTFDRAGCNVVARDGTPEHEAFSPDCFDPSIAAGGQVLSVGHGATPLAGSFAQLRNDGGLLVFRFSLFDGPRERRAAERIASGAIKGCSIAFRPIRGAAKYRDRILTHQRAQLDEISLCDGTKPQWYGTSCRVVRL